MDSRVAVIDWVLFVVLIAIFVKPNVGWRNALQLSSRKPPSLVPQRQETGCVCTALATVLGVTDPTSTPATRLEKFHPIPSKREVFSMVHRTNSATHRSLDLSPRNQSSGQIDLRSISSKRSLLLFILGLTRLQKQQAMSRGAEQSLINRAMNMQVVHFAYEHSPLSKG